MNNHKETFFSILQYILISGVTLCAVYYLPEKIHSHLNPDAGVQLLNGSRSFNAYLQSNHNSLSHIRAGNALLDLNTINLPDDLTVLPPDERSALFIRLMLNHAVRCNNTILSQRKKLIQYILDQDTGKTISETRKHWFKRLANHYRVAQASPEELLKYVDIVPVSLTIAQAITESGWGTSRFALQGNALYGQHLPKNSTNRFITSLYGGVKVAAFDSIYDSTMSYIFNLNTSDAYAALRSTRENLRINGEFPDGYSLAAGLLHYSAIGEDYIDDIRFLIRKYKLDELEATKINRQQPLRVIRFARQKEKAIGLAQNPLAANQEFTKHQRYSIDAQ